MTTGLQPRSVERERLEGDPAYAPNMPPVEPGPEASATPDDRALADALGHAGTLGAPGVLPNPQGVQEAVRAAPRTSLDKGELLYLQGDNADSAYLVESGLLALSIAARPGRERIIGLAGPGDIIGAHTEGQRYYLDSAAALSQEVNVVQFDLLSSSFGGFGPELRYLLGLAAVHHLERLTNQLLDTELPVPARVALTFLRLAERFGQVSAEGVTRLTLPLTHDTLAAMVGAARETTSTTIEQLRKLGLVTGTRGRYVVRSDGLRAFADLATAA